MIEKKAVIITAIPCEYGAIVKRLGFLTAASMTQGCLAMVVRGISDLINKKSKSDKDGWQDIAADNASAFAFQLLSKIEAALLLRP